MLKYNFFQQLFFLVILFGCLIRVDAQINSVEKLTVNGLFSNKMVLQQNSDVNIWGRSEPNEKVSVQTSWGLTEYATVSKFGTWIIKLKTPAASYDHHEIMIKSNREEIKIKKVLIGEVWLASGQSNIEMNFNYCCNTTDYSAKEIQTANNAAIRMFTVKKSLSTTSKDTLN